MILSENRHGVTGKALTEMLADPLARECIHEASTRHQTLPVFRKWSEDHRDGFFTSLFNPIPSSHFSEALDKLKKEEERLSSQPAVETEVNL